MSFLVQLFGKLTSSSKQADSEIMLEGDGSFLLAIVRESKYQSELEQICGGRTVDGADTVVSARLLLENGNPYDRGAVRVEVNGMTVGYLDQPDAKAYRKYLRKLGKPRAVGLCQANIRGGWKRGRGKQEGHFGVWLDFLLYG